MAAALAAVPGLVVVAALVVVIVDALDFNAGSVVDDSPVEEVEAEEVGREDEGGAEDVEAGNVEDGIDGGTTDTSVGNKVCTAVGPEVSPSLLRAEKPHV